MASSMSIAVNLVLVSCIVLSLALQRFLVAWGFTILLVIFIPYVGFVIAFFLIFGTLLYLSCRKIEPIKREVNAQRTAECPACGKLLTLSATVCKYCGQKLACNRPDQYSGEVCVTFFEKPEGMCLGEYQELVLRRYGSRRTASGYEFSGVEYFSFGDLAQAIRNSCKRQLSEHNCTDSAGTE